MAHYSEHNFTPENSIGYLVRRSEQLGTIALEPIFSRAGITKTQWSALVSLHFNGAQSCAEIARDLCHDKGAITRLVDTLEERDWVRRDRESGEDRRVIRLILTESGEQIACAVRDEVVQLWNHWLKDWDAADVDRLTELLRRLRDTIQNGPEQGTPA